MDQRTLLSVKCIEAAVKGLPSLPPVVSRILEETEKEDVSAMQIERLLSSDQALVAKVLRIVNSSYYGLAGQVRSISQAIVILGMQQVRNLVIGISAMGLIEVKNPADAMELQKLWEESFGTAVGSRAIGKLKGMGEVQLELLFVGGLLAQIGKLFLVAHFPDKLRQAKEIAHMKDGNLLEAEKLLLGLNQKDIGGMLADQWKLPADLTTLIRSEEPPSDPVLERNFYAIQAAAEVAACESPELTLNIDSKYRDWVSIEPEEWEWLKREMQMRVKAMADLCGVAA